MIILDKVHEDKKARVIEVQGGWGVRRRLGQMGIHPGDIITVLRYGPFGGIEMKGLDVPIVITPTLSLPRLSRGRGIPECPDEN
jgi:Fe2+ transport system protein FeoA